MQYIYLGLDDALMRFNQSICLPTIRMFLKLQNILISFGVKLVNFGAFSLKNNKELFEEFSHQIEESSLQRNQKSLRIKRIILTLCRPIHRIFHLFGIETATHNSDYIKFYTSVNIIYKLTEAYYNQPMSIIIKSDELNILIYKYLQQCNLSHTAYTLFNEANLDQSLSQYKFDVKSGQLISLIERALIFSQIQSHITINNYEQCKEPFYLLKSHVCKITQKIKQQKSNLMNQLNENIFSAIRRTSSIHNTLQPNKEYQQIIYDQRSSNFLDKVPLSLQCSSEQINLKISRGESVSEKYFCAYSPETITMNVINKKDNFLNVLGATTCKGKVQLFEVVDDLLIQIYDNNECSILQLSLNGVQEELLCFRLPLSTQCVQIKINKKAKQLIGFQSNGEFCIINLNTKKMLKKGYGLMEWVDIFTYLVFQKKQKKIKRYSLKPDNMQNNIEQFVCQMSQPSRIRISFSQIFFSVESIRQNLIYVYNFQHSQPLYIFDFKHTEIQDTDQIEANEKLTQVIWVTANSTDKLIFITDISIKTFDIELNNFSKIIQISNYDESVSKVGALKRDSDHMYLIALGHQNLIFYDVSSGKIERVQVSQDTPKDLFELNDYYYLGISSEDRISILQSSDIEPLFS